MAYLKYIIFVLLFYITLGLLAYYWESRMLWFIMGDLTPLLVEPFYRNSIYKLINSVDKKVKSPPIYQVSLRFQSFIYLAFITSIAGVVSFLFSFVSQYLTWYYLAMYSFIFGLLASFLREYLIPFKKWVSVLDDKIVIGNNRFYPSIDRVILFQNIEYVTFIKRNFLYNTCLNFKNGEKCNITIPENVRASLISQISKKVDMEKQN